MTDALKPFGHLPALTGLRGIAALLVTLFHAWPFVGAPKDESWFASTGFALHLPFATGYIGVDLFFVLSGFLLAQPFLRWANRHHKFPNLLSYAGRRIRRVVPAFWAQLIAIAVALLVTGASINWKDFAVTAAFLQHWFPGSLSIQNHNPVLWSLPVEFWFYALIPALALCVRHLRWWGTLALVLVVGVSYRWHCLSQLLAQNVDGLFGYASIMHLLARFDQFGIGVVFALAHLRFALDSAWRARAFALGLLLVVLLMPQLAARGDLFVRADYPYLFVHYPLLGLCWGLMAFGAAGNLHWGSRWLAARPLVFIGTVSYSLYLWHFPILVLCRDWITGINVWANVSLALAAAVLAAWISYRCFERPFLPAESKSENPRMGDAPPPGARP
jgi:peptidoglycan/LPS O-acetylase OafA/YrhL